MGALIFCATRTCHLHDFHSKDRDVPIEFPPLSDIATGFVFVGALFLLRFILALRRLRGESGQTGPFLSEMSRARSMGGFGEEHEPERRHAVRQVYIGLIFLTLGLALFARLLLTHLFGLASPIGSGG